MRFVRPPIRTDDFFRPPAPLPQAEKLGTISLLRALWDNPIEAWTLEHFERPIVVNRLPFGDVAVVNHPRAIRRVLTDDGTTYQKDRFQKRMLAVLSNGLLTAEAEQWRFQRRTVAPVFSLRTVRSFAPAMLQQINSLIKRWRSRDGEVIDVAEEVTGLALNMLERTIFSDGIAQNDHALRAAMRTYFDSLGRIDPFDLFDLPDFVPRLSRLRARRAIDLFDHAVDEMIAMRRGHLANRARSAPHDILTLLMRAHDPQTGRGLSDPEIRANVITFLSAGHESTANAITWALFLLSNWPEWSQRVVAEAEREDDEPTETLPDRLVETRAVIDEALRLYPPLAAISRVALADDKIAGVCIRRGTMIVIAPYILHRHRMWWDRPDIFDPGRFLPPSRENIDRYAYLPFGAGPRVCIGSTFAQQEATLAVAAIMQNFELDLAPGHKVWPVHRITLRPKGGLPMILRRRPPVLSPGLAPFELDTIAPQRAPAGY